jgi:23S rRNA (pseudouridine1915-N3)-methyltransferase
MNVHLLAVGQRMPAWVSEGYDEFARRLPHECSLKLIEIPAEKRGKNADVQQLMHKEGERLLAAIPKRAQVIALEVTGKPWSTEELAQQLQNWLRSGDDVALLVGGPDGLDPRCLERATARWSLSKLTLPHPLVRIVVAEQLYRAWTILKGHPYHRGGA